MAGAGWLLQSWRAERAVEQHGSGAGDSVAEIG
jgi:hypothetical protein